MVRRSRIKFPTLKAALMLDGEPIVMTRKVDGLDNTNSVHELVEVSLDIFDTNKKTIPIKRTIIAINTESYERGEGSEPASCPKRIIHKPKSELQPDSEAAEAQLHTSLEESLGNTTILPVCKGRRVFLHYMEYEVSPEEKMAKMAKYAYTPPRDHAMRSKQAKDKEQFILNLKRKRWIKVKFEDEVGEKTVKRIKRVLIEADE